MNQEICFRGNKNILLFTVVLLVATALAVAMILSYAESSRELKSLNRQFDETTANWKRIDEEKSLLKAELRELENRIADAEDDIESGKKRTRDIETLRTDVQALEAELASFPAD